MLGIKSLGVDSKLIVKSDFLRLHCKSLLMMFCFHLTFSWRRLYQKWSYDWWKKTHAAEKQGAHCWLTGLTVPIYHICNENESSRVPRLLHYFQFLSTCNPRSFLIFCFILYALLDLEWVRFSTRDFLIRVSPKFLFEKTEKSVDSCLQDQVWSWIQTNSYPMHYKTFIKTVLLKTFIHFLTSPFSPIWIPWRLLLE